MANGLTEERFLAYARTQIADTDRGLTEHGPHGGGCRCGRQLPCAEDKSLRDRRDYYTRKIKEVRAAAEPLPAAPAAHTSHPRHRTARLRALLAGLPHVGLRAVRRRSPEGSAP